MTTAKVREYFIDLGCDRSRYLEIGEGPPLLLLHGMGLASSANTFDLLMPHLADRFRVIALDLLGFGLGSRSVEAGPTFELLIDHVREFMDYLGEPRMHLVGHSLGGWLGGLLAYQSPQRIERMVMLCAAGLNREIAAGVSAKLDLSRQAFEHQVQHGVSDPERLSQSDVQLLVDGLLRAGSAPGAANSLSPLMAQMKNLVLRERYMLHRRLPYIDVPTLVIWGDKDPIEPYPTWAQEYDDIEGDVGRSSKPWVPPAARVARLAAGHYPHWELPEDTAGLIKDFFRS